MSQPRIAYIARENCILLLKDRGYDISEDATVISFADFQERMSRGTVLIDLYAEMPGIEDDSRRIYVRFLPVSSTANKKLTVGIIEKETAAIAQRLETFEGQYQNRFRIIFVTEEMPQAVVELTLKHDWKMVETMTFDQLQYNPTKHRLVPKHELVPRDEEDNILQKYNISRRNLSKEMPRISVNDAISRWYGFRQGQIIKITRNSEQTGRQIFFRVVV